MILLLVTFSESFHFALVTKVDFEEETTLSLSFQEKRLNNV